MYDRKSPCTKKMYHLCFKTSHLRLILLLHIFKHYRDTVCSRGLLPARPAFKLDHHDSDVVRASTVKGLKDDALGAKMRLVQPIPDEAHRLLVAEGVPQAVGRQDHELGLQLVQVE